MSMSPFQMTSVNLCDELRAGNPDDSFKKIEALKYKFYLLNEKKRESIASERLAAAATSRAAKLTGEHRELMMNFIIEAAEVSPLVAMETAWSTPYQNSKGDIILECPQTEMNSRMAMHMNHAEFAKAAKENGVRLEILDMNSVSEMFVSEDEPKVIDVSLESSHNFDLNDD